MLILRNIVTAFLMWKDEILLMKRGKYIKIRPGDWYGVGGHVEPEEINDPYSAIYREIYEETGIKEENIEDLKLKYIVYNKGEYEIVINHFFFGRVETQDCVENDEGSLHWIKRNEVLKKSFHPAINRVLKHYLTEAKEGILLGAVEGEEGYIWWHPL